MTLKDFDLFNSVTIQTHDNPDPDALASAFGLYKYFKTKGKDVEIVYSGRNKIQKANLMLMIQECGIPIKYVKDTEYQPKELLITVDCQYGEGNVTTLKANKVAIIRQLVQRKDPLRSASREIQGPRTRRRAL